MAIILRTARAIPADPRAGRGAAPRPARRVLLRPGRVPALGRAPVPADDGLPRRRTVSAWPKNRYGPFRGLVTAISRFPTFGTGLHAVRNRARRTEVAWARADRGAGPPSNAARGVPASAGAAALPHVAARRPAGLRAVLLPAVLVPVVPLRAAPFPGVAVRGSVRHAPVGHQRDRRRTDAPAARSSSVPGGVAVSATTSGPRSMKRSSP